MSALRVIRTCEVRHQPDILICDAGQKASVHVCEKCATLWLSFATYTSTLVSFKLSNDLSLFSFIKDYRYSFWKFWMPLFFEAEVRIYSIYTTYWCFDIKKKRKDILIFASVRLLSIITQCFNLSLFNIDSISLVDISI